VALIGRKRPPKHYSRKEDRTTSLCRSIGTGLKTITVGRWDLTTVAKWAHKGRKEKYEKLTPHMAPTLSRTLYEMSTLTIQAKRNHASCTVGTGRDRVSRGICAWPCGRQRGVVTGNGSTRLATGVVNKQKPTCPRPRDDKRQLRKPIQFGTWNVRTMTTDGKVEIVENEMTKLSIICLGVSEVRWTGKGHFVTDNGSIIIYSGSERKHEAGVGIILDKQTSVSMLGYNPISERLLTV